MHGLLLFLHFIGLALGIGVPIANFAIQRVAADSAPEAAAVLRSIPPRLTPFSWTGLGLLLVTGVLLLLVPGMGRFAFSQFWFWLKLLDVAALVGVVYLMWQTMQQVRAGDMAAAARMRMLGPAALGLGLLAVLFAVITFH